MNKPMLSELSEEDLKRLHEKLEEFKLEKHLGPVQDVIGSDFKCKYRNNFKARQEMKKKQLAKRRKKNKNSRKQRRLK